MTTSEKFKVWLETIYVSKKTRKNLTSGTQYVTGIYALNKILGLSNEGIFDINTDLDKIEELIKMPEFFNKDYSSHFQAFLKFRDFQIEQSDTNKKPLKRKVDVFKKQQVEISAVETTIQYYEQLGYIVISKEKDNVGWDLEASNTMETLLLEVKGLSGKIVSIELSPNEYQKSKKFSNKYRLCIVTNALIKPKLEIFSYSSKLNYWLNSKNEKLMIQEKIGARMIKQ